MPNFISWLTFSNPVLIREARAALRSVRAFALLAIYVSVLGAVVSAAFPSGSTISLEEGGTGQGLTLLGWLLAAQVGLIFLMLPAMSTGALAQERERGTLQTLLLTPLSPLQIVWGKAGGVLSLVGLMLLSSMPVACLCFLLGGVSLGQLVGCYAGLLGLAVLTTGFGLYCAARYPNATRALLVCYFMLPLVLALGLVATPLGSVLAGLFSLSLLFYGLVALLKRGQDKTLSRRLGGAYTGAIYPCAALVVIAVLWWVFDDSRNFGPVFVGFAFVLMYFLLAAQYGMRLTAAELLRRADPENSFRQQVEEFRRDMQVDWQSAVTSRVDEVTRGENVPANQVRSSTFAAGSYLPGESSKAAWAPIETPVATPTVPALPVAPVIRSKNTETYGKTPFLPDRLNPIFAREMRNGLIGNSSFFWRLAYGVVIISQLGLLAYLLLGLYDPSLLVINLAEDFKSWSLLEIHCVVLMILGTWFGARSLAREREGQTLSQLFVVPMRPRQIIAGKAGAALAFAGIFWLLPVPLMVLLALLQLIPYSNGLRFVTVELVLGFLAVAWGLWCSFHMATIRRALTTSLSGVGFFVSIHVLFFPFWRMLQSLQLVASKSGLPAKIVALFPLPLLTPVQKIQVVNTTFAGAINSGAPAFSPAVSLALLAYSLVGAGLLGWTALNFARLSRSGE